MKPKYKWCRIYPGKYVSLPVKWKIKSNGIGKKIHSRYRYWFLYDISNGGEVPIKEEFRSYKAAKNYAAELK